MITIRRFRSLTHWFLGIFTGLLLLDGTGCGRNEARSQKPLVVASFFPLYDFARQIGGPDFEVVCLVPPGGDPHAMEATPEIARTVARADLAILLGLGMDGWLEKMTGGKKPTRSITVSHGVTTRPTGKAALAEFAKDLPNPDETDPHVWLDPLIARQIVQQIIDGLVVLAPEKKVAIQSRGDVCLAELQKLHDDFTAASKSFHRRQVVTFHGAFAYLFARYNIEIAGVIELFPGDEPSAAYLRSLVDLMRKLGINVIFAEPELPDRPAQVIAKEIGGSVERLDPCETILSDAPQETYFDRQRRNLETLRKVLGSPSA